MSGPIAPDELRALLEQAAGDVEAPTFETVYLRARRARAVRRGALAAMAAGAVAVAVAVPIALTGHGPASRGVGPVSPSPSLSPSSLPNGTHRLDPLDLVGAWTVTGPHVTPNTSLLLGDEARLFVSCGLLQGTWIADAHGTFIGAVTGGDSACFRSGRTGEDPSVWLLDVVSYQISGPDRVLFDRQGRVAATLSPGAHPTTGPNDDPSFANPPTVTPALRARLAEPPPLAAGLQPATPLDVLATWKATDPNAGNALAFVHFRADRSWSGSDGCNGVGGLWAVDPGGRLLTVSGGQTLIGCRNSQVPTWVQQAGRVALVHGELVLYAHDDGHLLGRLRRA